MLSRWFTPTSTTSCSRTNRSIERREDVRPAGEAAAVDVHHHGVRFRQAGRQHIETETILALGLFSDLGARSQRLSSKDRPISGFMNSTPVA